MMTKNRKFKQNTFMKLANEYRRNMTDEAEIEKIDMTDIYFKETEIMIKEGELVIIQINAKVRGAKSTTAIAEGERVFSLLKKYKQRKKTDVFGMNNIARDDQEHSKLMRNPDTMFTVIVTDESNDLEGTGENTTTERALKNVFSNVQASRYVHRINCSPQDIIDPNTDIILEIVAVDRINKINHCNLFYRYFIGGEEVRQYLGYVNIYVGNLIANWLHVSKRFLKPNQTKADKAYIEKWRKKDYYIDYMVKKHEKMELITKEGIFRPRLLDYATVILKVIDKLEPLAKMTSLLNHNIVRNYVKMAMRQAKIPTSIVGEELATREVMGIMDLHKGYWKLQKDLNKAYANMEKAESDADLKKAKARIDQTKQMVNEMSNAIDIQMNELKKYEKINRKYNEHLEDGKTTQN